MGKRKISGIIKASEHPMTMETPWNQQQSDGSYHAYDGDDVEAFLKNEIGSRAKGITVNGREAARDSDGNVSINVDIVNVDESLDQTSTNAVSNAAATRAINELDANTVGSMDVEENDDGETLRLSLLNKRNQTIAAVDLPKGGSGDVSLSRISIRASVDHDRVKEGGSSRLTYTYDHIDGQGVSDGVKANLEIIIRRGTTTTYQNTLADVAAGTTGYLDISPYLLAGTVDVYVKASCVTGDGTAQTRQAYTSVSVITLDLTSSFNIADKLINGGYASGETIEVPFTITGSGDKVVTLYIDGIQTGAKTITRSGTTNEVFQLPASSYSAGRHNIQIVAARDGLLSDSLYMDFLVQGSSVPFIGTKITFTDGRVYQRTESQSMDPLTPTIDGAQYEQGTLQYVAWNPNKATTDLVVREEGVETGSMTVSRQSQTYQFRYAESGVKHLAFVSGATTYPFNIDVASSSLDISEATSGLRLKLSASGRSNTEAGRDNWGGVTRFIGVDWNTSGWTGDTLRLRNGAKAIVGFKPFETDAKATGLTVEMEFKISNVMDRDANVITCMEESGRGFNIAATEAQFYTGNTKIITDSDGGEHERPVGVNMNFAPNLLLKVAFVLHTNSTATTETGNSLMELYINGVRSKVDQYGAGDHFMQSTPQDITIDSTDADVEIRNMRIYNRALTEDEALSNYIVDRQTVEEMISIYTDNDVLGENGKISADLLRAKGRAVCIIIPSSSVDSANSENNKKTDFTASKVYWYSPYGEEYDFVAENIYFRIQGTSSTKYPRKNYRLYLSKGPDSAANTRLTVGGQAVSNKKYKMRPDSAAMSLFCLKADYSDSSMSMNTGAAKLFNTVMQELDLLTPPQQHQKDNGQAITVRQAVDGIPCDVFVAEEDGGEMTYYGQYNLNNEKSKSGTIFGMEGVSGYTPACPICLEGLNNSNPFCLFQSAGSQDSEALENQLQADFDNGFEFNYPEDVFYSEDGYNKSDASGKRYVNDTEKAAIKKLFGWIYECIPTAMRTSPDYTDIAKWASAKFKNEAASHFNVPHLLTYYICTDYWASVDQRAKNILWRTWDGDIWWATYYDGDTAQGMRNDSFLAYLYDITRDSWDDEAAKYAFEGHDSVLWMLVLANLEDELKTAASNLRNKLTTERMLQMFNVEQMGNWCERQYNRSGWFKYIAPQIEGVPLKKDGVVQTTTYDYLYALTGNREAHRTAFLTDRGNLLDARYGTSSYQSDRIALYASRTAEQAAQKVAITSGDLCYFGYRTNNGVFIDGPKRADKGETVELEFTGNMALNDPLNLCGASRITALDWRRGPSLGGNFELQLCRMLRELNISNELGSQMQTSLKITGLSTCIQLERVDITGQNGISTDGGTTFDLSAQLKLTTFKGNGTGLTAAIFAEGCPITLAELPDSLTSLRLRYLPSLTMDGLQIAGYGNITQFNFASCPNLDWDELLGRCTNVQYVRIEGISGKTDIATLERYKDLRGIDAQGNVTDTPRLVGEVTLTATISDEELATLQARYPELTINNAQYTMIMFDDTVSDPKNITNLENNTTGEDYQPSGHVLKIRNSLIPVKGRLNEATGVWEGVRLSDENYRKLRNGDDFDYTDSEGEGFDAMMRIPECWYKGVNDFKNQKKYICWSSLQEEPRSSATRINRRFLRDIIHTPDVAVMAGDASVGDTLATDGVLAATENHNAYSIDVEGMRQVRYPGVNHAKIGGVFLDADGVIVSAYNMAVAHTLFDFADGDYIFIPVPAGAKDFVFGSNAANNDLEAIAVDSDEIEAIEPDWVHSEPCLGGIYQASVDSLKQLRSISGATVRSGTGTNTTSSEWTYDTEGNPTNTPVGTLNFTNKDFINLAARRGAGYQLFDYEMSKLMAILYFSLTGNRDAQLLCGYGKYPGYTTGYTDTIGNTDSSFSGSSNGNKCLGFESFFGCVWEVMDNVGVNINSFESWKKNHHTDSGASDVVDHVWHIYDPISKTERTVQGLNVSEYCVGRVKHGRFCDVIASKFTTDKTLWAANYCDGQWYAAAKGRVAGRSHHSGNATGGLVFSHASGASSATSGGARLAFRGTILITD